jgi:hypothetical protein
MSPIQTTGGGKKPNTVFMRISKWTPQHGTQKTKTHNRTTTKKHQKDEQHGPHKKQGANSDTREVV